MNRGSDQLLDQHHDHRVASMRPRFMNRGSHCVGIPLLDLLPASMRPRFMNRGSARDQATHHGPGLGFNEAPIHESGK